MLPDVANRMIGAFCTDYAFRPNDNEMKAMVGWAITIEEDMLKRVLDPEGHPTSPGGRRQRPNLADLKIMANDIRRERGDFRRQENQSLLDNEECFYCSNGFVIVVDTRHLLWGSGVIGRCGHCQSGNKGSSWLKVVEPQARIIELAREWKIPCHEAVDRVVENRRKTIQPPVEGDLVDALPEHLKGLDEHKGTDAEQVPF